jgi:hypothetical protein
MVDLNRDKASDGAQKKNPLKGAVNAVLETPFLDNLVPFLPTELVGGSVPYLPGREDEMVWNAASQACSTERVYYCYTIQDNQCWYLASPSSALANAPDSWCPLSAALPGNSEFWDKQTVYVYEQDGAAGAIRWDQETGKMQVYLGATRTILPRLQTIESNFVSIKSDKAKIFPWKNRALQQEKLSRVFTRILMFTGLGTAVFALILWALAFLMSSVLQPNLDEAREISSKATTDLMVDATNALQSDSHRQLARAQQLLDQLSGFGGTLVRFEIKAGGAIEWEALVPRALEGNLSQLKATALGLDKDGRLRIRGTQ